MTVQVPEDIEKLLLARVAAGDFASPEEALREAMEPWLESEASRRRRLDVIREKIAEGDRDGTDLDPQQVRERLDALAAALATPPPDAA